jgi:hypothetical protein
VSSHTLDTVQSSSRKWRPSGSRLRYFVDTGPELSAPSSSTPLQSSRSYLIYGRPEDSLVWKAKMMRSMSWFHDALCHFHRLGNTLITNTPLRCLQRATTLLMGMLSLVTVGNYIVVDTNLYKVALQTTDLQYHSATLPSLHLDAHWERVSNRRSLWCPSPRQHTDKWRSAHGVHSSPRKVP